jgi:hypothetical protein
MAKPTGSTNPDAACSYPAPLGSHDAARSGPSLPEEVGLCEVGALDHVQLHLVGPTLVVTEGKPDIDLPPSDWFYHSRDEIEKDHVRKIAKAKTGKDRAAIKARTAELLADFDRQAKAHKATEPKELPMRRAGEMAGASDQRA